MREDWKTLGRFGVRCGVFMAILWASLVGHAQPNQGTSIAVDGAGNIYATGTFSRWADFDPGVGQAWLGVADPVEYGGGYTSSMGYLAKYAHDGSYQWAIHVVDERESAFGQGQLIDVAVDSDGFVYVVGTSYYATSFGGNLLNSDVWTAFVAKVRPDGGTVWKVQFDNTELGAMGSVGQNIALESDDSDATTGVVVSGWYRPTDPNIGDTSFIARFDPNGDLGWVKELGAPGCASINDLAADSSGVYAAGAFRKTLEFGLDEDGVLLTMTCADQWTADGFVAKFSDSDDGPVWQWGRQVVGLSLAAVASNGSHVYVSVGDNAQDNGVTSGLEFVAKLDTDGNEVWNLPCPNAIGYDIALRDGYLYLTGTFAGTVDFDLGTSTRNLTANGPRDIFVWKMTDGGGLEWAGQMGGPAGGGLPNERGAGIAVDPWGNVVTTGAFLGRPADFDPGPGTDMLVRLGRGDAFVSKVGPGMTHQWAFQIGSIDQFADDGQNDPGIGITYSQSGSGWKTVSSGGYMNDYRTCAKGTGKNKAQWVISGLPHGLYEVFATWKANSKNATNAQYTVNGVVTPPVSQRVTPDTVHLNTSVEWGATSRWKSLGRFHAVDGKITVELSDKANGTVVADAVRVLIYQP